MSLYSRKIGKPTKKAAGKGMIKLFGRGKKKPAASRRGPGKSKWIKSK